MPRLKTRRRVRSGVPGLTRRGERAYWCRSFPEKAGGDRIAKALEAPWESELAATRAGHLNTLYDRGAWGELRRWAAGHLHISEVAAAVLEGDWQRLRQTSAEGPLLAAETDEHLRRIGATRHSHTLAMHKSVCDALVARLGADYPMARMTVREAETFLHEPKPQTRSGATQPDRDAWRPWAAETQRFYRMVAGALWKGALEREAEAARKHRAHAVLTDNPWRKAEIKRTWAAPPAVLTEEEIRALLAHPAVAGTPTEALLAIAAWGGLRRQEITHLRLIEDVELDLWPPQLRVQSREGDQAWRTKTQRSQRRVQIPAALADTIRRHIAAGFSGSRYLFVAPNRRVQPAEIERPLHPATADRWAQGAFEAAGIRWGRAGEGLVLHSLRHACATLLLSEGVSVPAVAERLGDSATMILEVYGHAIPRDDERMLAILEAAARGQA